MRDLDVLIPLREAMQIEIPGDQNPTTYWRWATRGLKGINGERIRLDVTYCGRTPCTTRAAVRKFLADVTKARLNRIERRQQLNEKDEFMDPVHVIAVTDEFSGFDALYVGGELKLECDNIFPCDIAEYTKGMLIRFSHISVQMPEGEHHYPQCFDKCMLWNPVAVSQ